MVADTSTLLAENTYAVSLVHHDGDVFVFLLQLNNFRQFAEVTFHAEYAIHNNEFHAVRLALLDHLLKVFHVVVLVLELSGKAETTTVNNACVVTVIADDIVVTVNELADDAAVNCETSCKAEGFILADKLSKLFLELNMNVERAIQETASSATTTVFLHSCTTSIDHTLVASQSCIGIRAEHQDTSAFHDNLCTLFTFYLAEVRVNTLRHELLRESIFGTSFL